MKKIMIRLEGNKYVRFTPMLVDSKAESVPRELGTLFDNPETIEHVLKKFQLPKHELVIVEIPEYEIAIDTISEKYYTYSILSKASENYKKEEEK